MATTAISNGVNGKSDGVTVKLLMIGDSGVGKTSIISIYTDQTFRTNTVSTIGVDFKQKSVEVNNRKVSLRIWDTAGQDQFRSITRQYYRGAMGIVLVYDVTSLSSFTHITYWIRNISLYASPHVPKILVGNKIDVDPSLRQVPKEAGQEFANTLGIPYYECTATEFQTVEPLFYHMSELVLSNLDRQPVVDKDQPSVTAPSVKLQNSDSETEQVKNRKRCC